MLKKIIFIFLSLLLCQLVSAQALNDNGFNIFLKTGAAGFAPEKDLSFGFKEELQSHKLGIAIALGIGFQKALNKKGSFVASLNLQFAYAEFTQNNFGRFSRFSTSEFSGLADLDKNYQNQYLQAPIYLGWRKHRFTFSLGIAPTLHLKTKAIFEDVYSYNDGITPTEQLNYEKVTGSSDISKNNFDISYKRYIENPIDFQALVNISYAFKSWSIGLEVAHFLEDNYLVDESYSYNMTRTYKRYYRQYRRSMFLMLAKRF